jgi:hypothetical protein
MPVVNINQTDVPHVETVKYLGIHFDRRLTWKDHVSSKRKQLHLQTCEIKWLIGRHSPLSLENNIHIYKTVLKPVWTYGIELWGCASNSNIEIIQLYQSKLLRTITNAPWYVNNRTLHSDLHIRYVREDFQERIANHRTAITSHPLWYHLYALRPPGDDGHSTGCIREASLDNFLDHSQQKQLIISHETMYSGCFLIANKG